MGGARVNAAMRCGSVNVWYSSAAVVRNSSLSVSVVVLTEGPLPDVAVVVELEVDSLALLSEELS